MNWWAFEWTKVIKDQVLKCQISKAIDQLAYLTNRTNLERNLGNKHSNLEKLLI